MTDTATAGPRKLDQSAFDPPPDSATFYADALALLNESGVPYLVSGTYALACHTGITRPTKDMDVFCKAGDAPRLLHFFQQRGYRIEVEDERWIGKVWQGDNFLDVIYNVSSASIPVTDDWFATRCEVEIYGSVVPITPPTEFVLSKFFIQDRHRYDGADVAHVILKQHEAIDWHRLMSAMELQWEVLLLQILNFRFVYPTERDRVPRWVFDELTARLAAQADLPPANVKVCRGRLLSPRDYLVDICDWGFADVVGKGLEERHERHG